MRTGHRSAWFLATLLITVHLCLCALLFLGVHTSPDGEAGMAWYAIMPVVDFPLSMVTLQVDTSIWRHELFWFNESSAIRQFSQACGLDHLNVGAFIEFFITGTLQWGLIGLLAQAGWRRLRGTEDGSRQQASEQRADG